ncbi:MAG: putative sulfate exporter family transporter [Singulisphaera sp.]
MGDAPDIYSDPQLARWLDSMEGVPDWPEPVEAPVERASRTTLQNQLHQIFGWLGHCPGVMLALGLAFVGLRGADWLGTSLLGFAHSPISSILVALLLGLTIRNAIGLPAVYESGLKVCLRQVLRLGIMLLGLRLSLAAVGQIGLAGLPIIAGCIASALILVTWINRALGLPRRLGILIAVGTSICGVSAIVATGPVVDADEDEVSYAVACVTLFGLLALFCYPFLAHRIFRGDARMAGLFLGTAIHDRPRWPARPDVPAAVRRPRGARHGDRRQACATSSWPGSSPDGWPTAAARASTRRAARPSGTRSSHSSSSASWPWPRSAPWATWAPGRSWCSIATPGSGSWPVPTSPRAGAWRWPWLGWAWGRGWPSSASWAGDPSASDWPPPPGRRRELRPDHPARAPVLSPSATRHGPA